jgi:hypothetical protein
MSFYVKVLGPEINSSTYGVQGFTGNTANVSGNRILIGNKFVNNTPLFYTVAAGNTALTGLANGGSYYAVYANSLGLCVANSPGGANLVISTAVTSASETGHSFFGANNLNKAQQVRVTNLTGVAAPNSALRMFYANGTEYANLTMTASEIIYVQKGMTDTIWSANNSMLFTPVSLKG